MCLHKEVYAVCGDDDQDGTCVTTIYNETLATGNYTITEVTHEVYKNFDFVEGLYWCTITGTTVGFGDYSAGTSGSRWFLIFYLFFIVVAMGSFISAIQAWLTTSMNRDDIFKITQVCPPCNTPQTPRVCARVAPCAALWRRAAHAHPARLAPARSQPPVPSRARCRDPALPPLAACRGPNQWAPRAPGGLPPPPLLALTLPLPLFCGAKAGRGPNPKAGQERRRQDLQD